MQIIIPRNTFLEELFPGINDHKNLTEEDLVIIKEAYTNGGREPRITVEEDHISIILEEESQETSQAFDQLIALAEAGKFDKALRLANRLINEYPTAADLHRIKGQILSEQGHPMATHITEQLDHLPSAFVKTLTFDNDPEASGQNTKKLLVS